MNIFYLSHEPDEAAFWHVDKHVVKMIVESCQMLSTAHRLLDGISTLVEDESTKKNKLFFLLPNEKIVIKNGKLGIDNPLCYQVAHPKHPSTMWTMQSSEHYAWHVQLLLALLDEYTQRYGKVHSAVHRIVDFLKFPPNNIAISGFIEPPLAMPECYKVDKNSLLSYRQYYAGDKWRFAKWKHNTLPPWYIDTMKNCWKLSNQILVAKKVLSKKTMPADFRIISTIKELINQ